ncbi:MAG: hypothetical protein BCS36_01275 [Desulfovibrio sp. MES5]|uniref:pseudouridine synthase n=1 Tax=Desulfovibrio sp. MES5 TaxID=1899016 RepID=UPI000B9C9F6D|nr:MAG: hypothetical protein BCS36_01275 [Desulfovibrio sp. MES5]
MKPQFCGQNGPERNCDSPDVDGRKRQLRVDQQAGQRLDHALEALLPHLGVRGRKRCIESGLVLVNGRPAAASRRMREGDVICLAEAAAQPITGADLVSAPGTAPTPAPGDGAASASEHAPAQIMPATHSDPCSLATSLGLRMLDRQDDYCFFSKPANMHSAALAGSTEASVEALAPALAAAWHGPSRCRASGRACPPVTPDGSDNRGQAAQGQASQGAAQQQECMLLQRLDFGTSGLLCAALTPAAAAAFRAAEAAGHCEKRYVALLTGVLTGPVTARQSLGVSGRRKSRLRDAQADKTRWTDFWPLHVWHPDTMDAEELRLLFGVVPDPAGLASGIAGGMTAAQTASHTSGLAPGLEEDMAAGMAEGRAGEGHPLPEKASPASACGPLVRPFSLPPQGLTLAACRIRRGARHQIRVHAAGLGHALWGDALYANGDGALPDAFGGAEPSPDLPGFFLHHGGLRLPGAACVDYPPWPLPEALSRLVRAWFEGVLPQAEQQALKKS